MPQYDLSSAVVSFKIVLTFVAYIVMASTGNCGLLKPSIELSILLLECLWLIEVPLRYSSPLIYLLDGRI